MARTKPGGSTMNLVINDRPLLGKHSGIARYLRETLRAWPSHHGDSLRSVCSRVDKLGPLRQSRLTLDALSPLTLRPFNTITPPKVPGPLDVLRQGVKRRAFRAYASLRVRQLTDSGSVYFEPNHVAVANAERVVTTVHDLSVVDVPQYHPADRVRAWQRTFERSLEWTSRFICVSRATASRLEAVYAVPAEKIRVVYPGMHPTDIDPACTPVAARKRLGLPEATIVHVGTIEPRKNLRTLFTAVAKLRETRPETRLLLIGSIGWGEPEFWDALMNHPEAPSVLYAGALPDEQAAGAVLASRCLVYPSHYEGFGLPPLEAMSLGVPVVASKAASLDEVVGSLGRRVEAEDTEGWMSAIQETIEGGADDPTNLIEHASRFTWTSTAEQHRAVFEELIAQA